MLAVIRRHGETIIVAAVVAAVVAGGPSLAGAVFDANNAHKVDGKHAVGSGASTNARKGKLVATSKQTGRLPNNIIQKAPDANRLDGNDSADFAPALHPHDAADILSGTLDDARIAGEIARDTEIFPKVLDGDGSGSGLDSDLLDGLNSDSFASATHPHAGEDITTGTVADARIAAALARDAEVMSLVLNNDGPGSGLNADLLDGLSSNAFAATGHGHSGNEITSGTVAAARIDDAISRDAEVMSLVLANDGPGSNLNADFLDGLSSNSFAATSHGHSGNDITSGTVAAARIDDAISRDAEVMSLVLANDGPGSNLNADFIDGLNSTAFAATSHGHSGNDITSGTVAAARIDDAISRDAEVMTTVLANDGPGSGLNADLIDNLNSSDLVQSFGSSQIAVHQDVFSWETADSSISRTLNVENMSVSSNSTGSKTFMMSPSLPGQLYGNDLQFQGLVLCYDATDAGTTLDNVTVFRVDNSTGTPAAALVHDDGTNRDDQACRTYAPQFGTVNLDAAKHVTVQVSVTWNNMNTPFRFARTTALFTP